MKGVFNLLVVAECSVAEATAAVSVSRVRTNNGGACGGQPLHSAACWFNTWCNIHSLSSPCLAIN